MHSEDLLPPAHIGPADVHLAVETTGTHERRVEHVGTVRRGDHDDVGVVVKAVHLDEDLVQRLLALVVPAAQASAAHPAYRVDLVRSEEHTSELQSRENLVCRLLLDKKKSSNVK